MSPEQFADQLPDQAQFTTRDNALAEPTIGFFKTEAIGTGSPFRSAPPRTVDDVEYATNEWVDWYSNRRLHSVLDYIPPEEYQTLYYADLRHGALPAGGNETMFLSQLPYVPVGDLVPWCPTHIDQAISRTKHCVRQWNRER